MPGQSLSWGRRERLARPGHLVSVRPVHPPLPVPEQEGGGCRLWAGPQLPSQQLLPEPLPGTGLRERGEVRLGRHQGQPAPAQTCPMARAEAQQPCPALRSPQAVPWATSELGLGPAPASSPPSRKVGREAAVARPANQAPPGGHSTASQTGYTLGLGPYVPHPGGLTRPCPAHHGRHWALDAHLGRPRSPRGGPSHPAGLADNHRGH